MLARPARLGRRAALAAIGALVPAAGVAAACPDGPRASTDEPRLLVFAAIGAGERFDLFEIRDGGERVPLTTTPDADESFPRLSADGRRLAWIEGTRPGLGRIVVANSDGSGATPIPGGSEYRSVAWAPDGRHVVSSSFADAGQLVVIDIATGAVTPIPGTDGADSPDYSTDGRSIVFRKELPGNDEIYRVDLEAGSVVRLTTRGDVNDLGPRYSPDGSSIAWSSGEYPADAICTMHPDGSEQRCLLPAVEEAENPSWTHDGRQIVFDRRGDLWAIDAAGGTPRRVVSDASFADASHWTP